MSLFRKAPQKGAKNRRVHFPFITTPKGYSFEAHIAGPCHWFDCHDMGRSKPCLHCITNGELKCARNHDIDEPIEIGYQPLWQKDTGKPGFVIVYEFARDQIDKLRLHHLVCVSRGKGPADTVAINYKGINAPLYKSTREDFMRPVDLTESLLRIWKLPELVAWVRMKNGQPAPDAISEQKKVPKLKPLKSDGKAFDAMHEQAALKYGEQGVEDAAVGYGKILKQAQEAEAKHRKTGHLETPAE